MSEQDYNNLLIDFFCRLQRHFRLGVGDLLAALRLVGGEWEFDGLERLRDDLRMLWCATRFDLDRDRFDDAWRSVLEERRLRREAPAGAQPTSTILEPQRVEEETYAPHQQPLHTAEQEAVKPGGLLVFPSRSAPVPVPTEEPEEINPHWQLSRRSMDYGWRYLRLNIPDGPANIIDINATIEDTARSGIYLGPHYRRQQTNYARLLVLVDCGGSMVPFHRFTRDLVESAQSSTHFDLESVAVRYFHNAISDYVCENRYLSRRELLAKMLERCDGETSILLVSDAGAARGLYRPERVRATSSFVMKLRRKTGLIAWLNPMPETRWAGTSAEVISFMVDMFPMDHDGFVGAIAVARGAQLLMAA